jgi:hypothetical protein
VLGTANRDHCIWCSRLPNLLLNDKTRVSLPNIVDCSSREEIRIAAFYRLVLKPHNKNGRHRLIDLVAAHTGSKRSWLSVLQRTTRSRLAYLSCAAYGPAMPCSDMRPIQLLVEAARQLLDVSHGALLVSR